MTNDEEIEDITEIKKEIAIERLRQAPSTIKVSFGIESGEFMDRDEMIKQVENDSDIGKKIVKMQLEYLKAFKKKTFSGG